MPRSAQLEVSLHYYKKRIKVSVRKTLMEGTRCLLLAYERLFEKRDQAAVEEAACSALLRVPPKISSWRLFFGSAVRSWNVGLDWK